MGESNENPFAAFDIATQIKDCIVPYLEMTSKGLPERICVTSGEIAWDNCECGQLAVSMQNKNEANAPNQPRASATAPGRRACGPPLMQMNFLVSMTRCAPTGTGGKPPTCDQLSDAARVAAEDAWAVMSGLSCCLYEAIRERLPNGTTLYEDFIIGQQDFVGPQGMCQGSQVPVAVVVRNGCPCVAVS